MGLTKAGLLHYVGSKDNLLTLVMRDVYDADAMAKLGADGDDQPVGTVSLPGYLRDVVAQNAERPHLVRLFTMAQHRNLNPDHRRASTSRTGSGCWSIWRTTPVGGFPKAWTSTLHSTRR